MGERCGWLPAAKALGRPLRPERVARRVSIAARGHQPLLEFDDLGCERGYDHAFRQQMYESMPLELEQRWQQFLTAREPSDSVPFRSVSRLDVRRLGRLKPDQCRTMWSGSDQAASQARHVFPLARSNLAMEFRAGRSQRPELSRPLERN